MQISLAWPLRSLNLTSEKKAPKKARPRLLERVAEMTTEMNAFEKPLFFLMRSGI